MLNRWVLSWDRKTATEGAEVTKSGRLFQKRAAATGWQSMNRMNWNGVADETMRTMPELHGGRGRGRGRGRNFWPRGLHIPVLATLQRGAKDKTVCMWNIHWEPRQGGGIFADAEASNPWHDYCATSSVKHRVLESASQLRVTVTIGLLLRIAAEKSSCKSVHVRQGANTSARFGAAVS